MKLFTVKKIKNSHQLFDEKNILIGEKIAGFWSGINEKLKIVNQYLTIKYSGFLFYDIKFFDTDEKLVIKIESSKSRLFYYGPNSTEVYQFRSYGFFRSFFTLHRFEDDKEVIRFKKEKPFLKNIYQMDIDDDFNNYLIILAFMHHNIQNIESA